MELVDMPVEFVVHASVKYFCSQMPCFIHLILRTPYHMFCTVNPMSHVSCLILCTPCIILCTSCLILCTSCLILCILCTPCLMSHTAHPISHVLYCEPNVSCLIPCTPYHTVHFMSSHTTNWNLTYL